MSLQGNTKKRKIGLFGGTFDPVHFGHLRMAEECRTKLQLEEIWFIPAAQPPHKDWQPSSLEKRCEWLKKALGDTPGCRILDIEKERDGKSYTYHTLVELHKREPDCEFYFLTGADSLEKLDTWYRWQDILDLCYFVATSRPGYAGKLSEVLRAESEKRKYGIICLQIDALDISSTGVREQVALRKDVRQLIPEIIIDEVNNSVEVKIEGYKEILKKRLSVKRYMHSIGVANTAARLAGIFNGNIEKAYLAGLLHDYAREVPNAELLELAVEHNLYSDAVDLLQPSLLHGPVGAWMLKEQGILEDEQVLDAIRWHTTGHPDMDQLARIIYIADYIEPNRDFPGVDLLRQLTHQDLNLGVLAGIDHTLGFLIQKDGYMHPLSIATRNRLLAEKQEKSIN
ncbi:MAG: nicotinate-nucleotide adenylyltransferase [Peptococcaceae bacterium]|nr:nicotinate-nucleotide adenylyltransferase [Peptococcaceae bacterium]